MNARRRPPMAPEPPIRLDEDNPPPGVVVLEGEVLDRFIEQAMRDRQRDNNNQRNRSR